MKKIIKSSINIFIVVPFIILGIILILLIDKYSKKIMIEKYEILVNSSFDNKEIYDDNIDEIQKLREKFNNNDIKGILYISDIITIPIIQSNDNKYYLKHNLNKELMPGGAIFMDYRTNIEDKQINIYGHNSTKYDLPFKKLEQYLDSDFAKNNIYIKLKTENKTYKYEIFSIYTCIKSKDNEHYKFKYNKNEEWILHYNKLKDKSIYEFNININEYDNIIIIQTCLFKENKNKFLIIGAKELKN